MINGAKMTERDTKAVERIVHVKDKVLPQP
jgi:hypothetical protein